MGNIVVALFKIPKIGDVCACSKAASSGITKRMARGDSAHWIGPVGGSKALVDCSWSTSKVVNLAVTASQIPKIGDVCSCSMATIDRISRRMVRWDSAHEVGLGCQSKGLADCSWSTSKVVNIAVAGSQIRKIGGICAWHWLTTGWIAKRMGRRDSAHWIGLVRHSLGLADCS